MLLFNAPAFSQCRLYIQTKIQKNTSKKNSAPQRAIAKNQKQIRFLQLKYYPQLNQTQLKNLIALIRNSRQDCQIIYPASKQQNDNGNTEIEQTRFEQQIHLVWKILLIFINRTIQIQSLSFGFQPFSNFTIQTARQTVRLQTRFIKNSVPLKISTSCKRITVCRFVNSINSQLRLGKICMDPGSGSLKFVICWNLDRQELDKVHKNGTVDSWIRNIFIKAYEADASRVKLNFLRVLQVIGELPFGFQLMQNKIRQKRTYEDLRLYIKQTLEEERKKPQECKMEPYQIQEKIKNKKKQLIDIRPLKIADRIRSELIEGILKISHMEPSFQAQSARLVRHLAPYSIKRAVSPQSFNLQVPLIPHMRKQQSLFLARVQTYPITWDDKENFNKMKEIQNRCLPKATQLRRLLDLYGCFKTALYDCSQPSLAESESYNGILELRQAAIQLLYLYLSQLILRYQSPAQRSNLHSQVIVDRADEIRWVEVGAGGYARVSKGIAKYCHLKTKEDRERPVPDLKDKAEWMERVLARKTDILQNSKNSRVAHQKKIAQSLSIFQSNQIVRFYTVTQGVLKNDLLMDYWPAKSYENYASLRKNSLSPQSKAWMASHFSSGLCFFKDVGVFHRDLKPQNLLVGKSLIVKITDFGESFIERRQLKILSLKIWEFLSIRPQYVTGFTIPYACPQQLQRVTDHKTRRLSLETCNYKMDNFAAGMILFEIFNNYAMVDFRAISHANMILKFKDRQYMRNVLIVPQRARKYECQTMGNLAELATLLCLRLINQNSQERSCMDWIQITLKMLYQSIIDQVQV